MGSIMDQILEKGYIDMPIEDDLDLQREIVALKREKNAVLLAHYYQDGAIQDIADFTGDSLALAQAAAKTDADIIVFAGVHFMAETAKILNPGKKVLLPDLNAGCSLAASCPPERLEKYIKENPGHVVVSYINCSAEVKALSDIICTSSNAMDVINSIPADQPVIFAPDVHMGRFIQKMTGREMLLWDGACEVHEAFSRDKILSLKSSNPQAHIIAHPECAAHVLDIADFIGSTSKLLNYAAENESDTYIVVTEAGILHQMRQKFPDKEFIPAPLVQYTQCACGECPYMKMNTLEKLYLCLKYEQPEIKMPASLISKALKPLERMFQLSKAS